MIAGLLPAKEFENKKSEILAAGDAPHFTFFTLTAQRFVQQSVRSSMFILNSFMHPTQSILLSPTLVIRHTNTPRGRGVFTLQDHQPGSLITVSPIIEVHHAWHELPSDVKRVVYDWSYLLGQSQHPHVSAIALGAGSLFNHSDDPNVLFQADAQRQAIVFTAARDIAEGEELTINYNADIDPQSGDNWFDLVGIEQH